MNRFSLSFPVGPANLLALKVQTAIAIANANATVAVVFSLFLFHAAVVFVVRWG